MNKYIIGVLILAGLLAVALFFAPDERRWRKSKK